MKRLLAIGLACASIGCTVVPMTTTSVNAEASNTGGSVIIENYRYTKNSYDKKYEAKAEAVKYKSQYKNGTNMAKVYFVAMSQLGYNPKYSRGVLY